MARNPTWTRDELILALDLYFRVNPLHTSEKHPKIQDLSALLNALPVHKARPDAAVFRNPNGVYMKMCNYLRLDPSYEGKGLERGGKLEEVIWEEFAEDPKRLKATADAIREGHTTVSPAEVAAEVPSDDEEFSEGSVLTAIHKRRERSPTLSRKKKQRVLQSTGRLACEVCGFDFAERYGPLGAGFAECHHTTPVSELDRGSKTRLSDLAIVCANCHRVIHLSRPMLTIEQLQSRLVEFSP